MCQFLHFFHDKRAGVFAIESTDTSFAPAFKRVFAHSDAVAPVVTTSSISKTSLFLKSCLLIALKLPCKFLIRSAFPSVAWRSTFLTRSRAFTIGIPVKDENSRHNSNDWLYPLSFSLSFGIGTKVTTSAIMSTVSNLFARSFASGIANAFLPPYLNFNIAGEDFSL